MCDRFPLETVPPLDLAGDEVRMLSAYFGRTHFSDMG